MLRETIFTLDVMIVNGIVVLELDRALPWLQVNSSINYLEAMQYKLECAVADVDGRAKPQFKHSTHIEKTRDKAVSDIVTMVTEASYIRAVTMETQVVQ